MEQTLEPEFESLLHPVLGRFAQPRASVCSSVKWSDDTS